MPSERPLRVLVVDDEPDTAESTATLLSLHGFDAAHACGGDEALTAAPADPPDVVLIDLAMPRMGGCEVARRLRALGLPRMPVLVALTGMTTAGNRDQALAAGFAHYLVKPVPPDDLVDLLRQCEKDRAGPV
jgi:CheY-like chemotaxis protein